MADLGDAAAPEEAVAVAHKAGRRTSAVRASLLLYNALIVALMSLVWAPHPTSIGAAWACMPWNARRLGDMTQPVALDLGVAVLRTFSGRCGQGNVSCSCLSSTSGSGWDIKEASSIF